MSMLHIVVDQLSWIDVHQHLVDVVTEAFHSGFLRWNGRSTQVCREVSRCSEHSMQVLCASVNVHSLSLEHWLAIEELLLLSLALAPLLEFLEH